MYNWYDNEGNLVYVGKDYRADPEFTKKYKLEVIALQDGIKDYSEVLVKVKECETINVSPNPVNDYVTIDYKLTEINSSYLMFVSVYGDNYNFLLDLNQSSISLDLSSLPSGI